MQRRVGSDAEQAAIELPVQRLDRLDLFPGAVHQHLLVLQNDFPAQSGDRTVMNVQIEFGQPGVTLIFFRFQGGGHHVAGAVHGRDHDRIVPVRRHTLRGLADLHGVLQKDGV